MCIRDSAQYQVKQLFPQFQFCKNDATTNNLFASAQWEISNPNDWIETTDCTSQFHSDGISNWDEPCRDKSDMRYLPVEFDFCWDDDYSTMEFCDDPWADTSCRLSSDEDLWYGDCEEAELDDWFDDPHFFGDHVLASAKQRTKRANVKIDHISESAAKLLRERRQEINRIWESRRTDKWVQHKKIPKGNKRKNRDASQSADNVKPKKVQKINNL
eukprot:TRINITY_DN5794_c0_g1_i1.p1 TRINITY_DN5794_c0_g1~~TRINITY_DN5794_c0_g1_i1.p1  ORF type:complete len:215 (+),score=39.50 TRINITY_DN5794_c0_g1_i1:27-671(+)